MSAPPVTSRELELLLALVEQMEASPDSLWRRWGRHLRLDWVTLGVLLRK
jgi:hypothetical protein